MLTKMTNTKRFFADTNVLVYLISDDASKARTAAEILKAAPFISVQVLNEFVSVARRKHKKSWDDIHDVLDFVKTAPGAYPEFDWPEYYARFCEELKKKYPDEDKREGPHLISVDELRAAGALDVPAWMRKSLRNEEPNLFSDLDDDEDTSEE